MNDRGHIKWTSMMLPEHRKLLLDFIDEQKQRERPILDEQRIDELNQQLVRAERQQCEVTLIVYGQYTDEVVCGQITSIDPQLKQVTLLSKDEIRYVKFIDILSVD